ncbi:MAG TPA: hypothetical protein VF177_01155 [Anaerolineae bacterium]
MELSTLLLLIGVLACPIAMGVMMWMMNRNMEEQPGQTMSGHTSEADRLEALRTQRQFLEEEIAELEKVVALEARKKNIIRAGETPSDNQLQPVEGIGN